MREGRTSSSRLSVYEAADAMGVTVDAIRKRISRDTIPHQRDEDGRVWVLLDIDQDAASKVQDTDQPQSDVTALISSKDETIAVLREQLEAERENLQAERNAHAEARRIIAGLVERVPALEAPSEPSESSTEGAVPRPGTTGPPEAEEPTTPRPWWRRVFGG